MDRRQFIEMAGAAAITSRSPDSRSFVTTSSPAATPSSDYQIAAYYFGNYHVDPRNEEAHGKGWTEWEIVKHATPRFPGHHQPRVPLWGYGDEAQPHIFEQKISAAAEHGLTSFIFDWYWYNDGGFLSKALENGYLRASNCEDLKFAIMWANHDWYDLHPAKLRGTPRLLYPGDITLETFRRATSHIIRTYFSQPSYWKINGANYFSIYELSRMVKCLGGVNAMGSALQEFRDKTRAAGFGDLHINAVTWGVQLLPGEASVHDLPGLLHALNIDSVTSYVWIHHVPFTQFPSERYEDVARKYETYRSQAEAQLGKPYFPNVSVGWDSSPRTCQSDIYTNSAYPFTPVVVDNSPAAFKAALLSAKHFLDARPQHDPRILTVNSWNEWTEGSYLEPDMEHRLGYLEAVKDVFRPIRP